MKTIGEPDGFKIVWLLRGFYYLFRPAGKNQSRKFYPKGFGRPGEYAN